MNCNSFICISKKGKEWGKSGTSVQAPCCVWSLGTLKLLWVSESAVGDPDDQAWA